MGILSGIFKTAKRNIKEQVIGHPSKIKRGGKIYYRSSRMGWNTKKDAQNALKRAKKNANVTVQGKIQYNKEIERYMIYTRTPKKRRYKTPKSV